MYSVQTTSHAFRLNVTRVNGLFALCYDVDSTEHDNPIYLCVKLGV